MILLVRLVVYIVNWCVFYSYWLIGKLTAFLQIQEFSYLNLPVVSSTSDTQTSPKSKVHNFLIKDAALWTTLNIRSMGLL